MRDLFEKRQLYEDYTKLVRADVFDNWDSRQFLYGKINKENRSISPLDRTSLKQIINSENVFVLNFVADAFEDMKEYYAKSFNSATNFQVNKFAGQPVLTARRGYIKPIGLYRQKMQEAQRIFVEEYMFGLKIHTFEQVLERFNVFVADYSNKIPMLFSTFVSSSSCPIHCSGLVLEITNDSHQQGTAKRKMLLDENYEFYANMVEKFGFVTAKNAPWCLVANLQSPIMYEYAKFYDVKKQDDIIDEYYYECKDFDIDLIREFVYESFLKLTTQDYVETTHRICNNRTVTKNVLRKAVDIKGEIDNFDNNRWVEIYLRILMLQKGVTVNEQRLEALLSEFLTIYQQTDFEKMYKFVTEKIQKLPRSLDIQSRVLYSGDTNQAGATGAISGY